MFPIPDILFASLNKSNEANEEQSFIVYFPLIGSAVHETRPIVKSAQRFKLKRMFLKTRQLCVC